MNAGHMSYTTCTKCNDPIPAPLISRDKEQMVTCANPACLNNFPFDPEKIETGVVLYDEQANRWKLNRPISKMMSEREARR
jgi:hypothetical protein